MLLLDQHPHNKSIMVAVLGKPNAGKSSLINSYLGFDLAIVSHLPQTTRNHFHCALTIDHTEIVFVDTPGVHTSSQELNIRMNGQAQMGSEGADLNLLLIELSADRMVSDAREFVREFGDNLGRTFIVFTKKDLIGISDEKIKKVFEEIKAFIPTAEKYFVISTPNGDGVHLLTAGILDEAQPGPHHYPMGDVSNKPMRFFAAEYIREQAFHILKEELPYETAVVIEEYKDAFSKKGALEGEETKISASILVNRPSQRAIVVGSKGSVIKAIGTNSRRKIEEMVGGRVHLNLHVKVSPKWFKNNFVLDELELPRTQHSHRVWRKR